MTTLERTGPPARFTVRSALRSPPQLTREVLAGLVTTLALVPEVISFSIVAGVDPMVSLVASVVLALTMSVLGGRPASSRPPPAPSPWSSRPSSTSTASRTSCRRCSSPGSSRSSSASPASPG